MSFKLRILTLRIRFLSQIKLILFSFCWNLHWNKGVKISISMRISNIFRFKFWRGLTFLTSVKIITLETAFLPKLLWETTNALYSNVPFLYPLNTSENLWFSENFKGYTNGTLDENGLNKQMVSHPAFNCSKLTI